MGLSKKLRDEKSTACKKKQIHCTKHLQMGRLLRWIPSLHPKTENLFHQKFVEKIRQQAIVFANYFSLS